MSKSQVIEFLQAKIPDNARIEITGTVAEPKPIDYLYQKGMTYVKRTNTVLGMEMEDCFELRVKYYASSM